MKKLILAILVAACAAAPSSDLDTYIHSNGKLSVADEAPKAEIACEDFCPQEGQEGDSYCSYKRYQQTGRFDQFVALQPNSAALWPGNIIRGVEAAQGLLTPVGLKQAPVTFSISLENLKAKPAAKLSEPSLSAFREARNNILSAGMSGSTPAAMNLSIREVKSLDDVAFQLGVGVSWPGANKVSGNFQFNKDSKTSKILVDFTQAYYTIDVDAISRPGLFFDGSVTLEELQGTLGSQPNPPLYIQSITYGRRVIFTIETESSTSEVKAALEAAYKSGADISGEVSGSSKSTLDTSSINAFVLGGSGEEAVGVVQGFDGVVKYIQSGGNYSKTSPGAPIAYKLAYLDNTVTQLAFTTDYAEKTCNRNQGPLKVKLEGIQQTGGSQSLQLYGFVSLIVPTPDNDARACGEGEQVDLWYLGYNQWQDIPRGGTWSPATPVEDTVPLVLYGKGHEICLMAHLWNYNGDNWLNIQDDELELTYKTIYFEETWDGKYYISLNGPENMAVSVIISLKGE
jgi:thiol-activated cytolysin